MYLCVDCNKTFDEPAGWTETHGLDSPPYETWIGCPHCGGMYVEAIFCDLCGRWVSNEYIELKDGSIICENCYEIKNVE